MRHTAIFNLYPSIVNIDDGSGCFDRGGNLVIVDEELVQVEVARLQALVPFTRCKEKAKQLLAETDWAVLPDVGLANQDAFVFYRLNLRNLVKSPVADPVFEDVPQAIWS